MVLAAGAGLLAILLGGCVERRLVIGSDPAGALVWVNDVEVGRTPVTVPFEWYGDYDLKFRLDKDVGTPGKPDVRHYYLHTHMKTTTPWFEQIGVDLFTETSPAKFTDEQVWAFAIPQVAEPTDADLVARANQLKGELDKEQSRVNK